MTQKNFAAARQNMVDCQINTNGVVEPLVLQAFLSVEREQFVPADQQGVAYSESSIIVNAHSFIPAPMVHAKMLQAAQVKPGHVVLDVGCNSGYTAAIAAQIADVVVTVDPFKKQLDTVEASAQKAGINNIVCIKAPYAEGCSAHGPYDAIILNGAVTAVPQSLHDVLVEGGRLIALVQPAPHIAGRVHLFQKLPSGQITSKSLFDASLPYLKGYEPEEKFVF